MKNISLLLLLITFSGFSQSDFSGFFLVNEKNEGIPLREIEKEEMVYVDSTAIIQLSEIQEMEIVKPQHQTGYLITFQLNKAGTTKLKTFTKRASIPSQRMALVLESVIFNNAYINSEIINGRFSLSGFDLIKANAVLNLLNKTKAKTLVEEH